MLEKIPPPVMDWIAPLWVWALGFLGAVVGYLEDFHLEDTWKVWLLKAATKLSSSSLAAVLTYHALIAMEIGQQWHVILIGVAGHMGVEALRAFGEMWKTRMGGK